MGVKKKKVIIELRQFVPNLSYTLKKNSSFCMIHCEKSCFRFYTSSLSISLEPLYKVIEEDNKFFLISA